MSLASLDALRAPSAAFPGQSTAARCIARMQDVASPMPPSSSAPASAAEVAVLSAWVTEGMPECTGSTGAPPVYTSPNQIPQEQLFQCAPGTVGSSPGRLRRISRGEWAATFIENGPAGAPFEDDPLNQYSTYAVNEGIDEAAIQLYMFPGVLDVAGAKVMEFLGQIVPAGDRANVDCMKDDEDPDAACVEGFAEVLLRRAILFRAPTAAELGSTTAFAREALAREAGTRSDTLNEVASAAWMSSAALFRQELGGSEGPPRAALTDWELAQSLAMVIGSQMPGAPQRKLLSGHTTTGPEGYCPTWSWQPRPERFSKTPPSSGC